MSKLAFSLYISLLLLLRLVETKPAISLDYLKLPLLRSNHSASLAETLASDHQRVRSPLVSGAVTGSGQYFVDLRIGTPPQRQLLVADTGSDIVWIRCSACRDCSGRPPGSAFLARHSSTFKPHHCYDEVCRLVPRPDPNRCNRTRLHSPCRFVYTYADGSATSGFFSSDATALRLSSGGETTTTTRGVKFGCSFRTSGPSVTGQSFNGAQGVLGLGRGPISFSTQLGRRFGNKFSYCLMDYTISPPPRSYLAIGASPTINREKMRFTPLLTNPLSPTFYYVGIKRVYVDGRKLPISPSVWSVDELGNGGTVIDSGTTLTFLVEPAYRLVLAEFRRRVRLPSPDESVPGFDLCVNVSGESRPRLPRISFELGGDSVFSPPVRNYFIEAAERVKCLAIQPVNSGSGFSVIGNLMQQGFLFEFDRDRSTLGFTRHGCGRP